MLLILTNDALVLRAFAVLANAAPSNIDYAIHKAYIKDYGTTGYITALNDRSEGRRVGKEGRSRLSPND